MVLIAVTLCQNQSGKPRLTVLKLPDPHPCMGQQMVFCPDFSAQCGCQLCFAQLGAAAGYLYALSNKRAAGMADRCPPACLQPSSGRSCMPLRTTEMSQSTCAHH